MEIMEPIEEAAVVVVPDVVADAVPVAAIPVADVIDLRPDRLRLAVKRAFDVVASLVAILVCLPVMLLIAGAVALSSRGSVFYVQRRVGRFGRAFPLLKFRTMHRGADVVLAEYLAERPELAEQWAAYRKLPYDPRVTRVGRLLRRFSLDELPQLLNVVAGHMSVVGPRPVTSEELSYFGDRADEVLTMRPGLTGLWAISGRSTIGYDERVELEHRYVRTWGIRRDLGIIARTIPAVFRGNGAY